VRRSALRPDRFAVALAVFVIAGALIVSALLSSGAQAQSTYTKRQAALVVYTVGKRNGVTHKQMLAAFEAALVESEFNNRATNGSYTGLFQMYAGPSSSCRSGVRSRRYGSRSQLFNPRYVSCIFFGIAKKAPSGYGPGQIAHFVEVGPPASAYTARYSQATRLLNRARADYQAGGSTSGSGGTGSTGGVSPS
jgi:hypothetical protein